MSHTETKVRIAQVDSRLKIVGESHATLKYVKMGLTSKEILCKDVHCGIFLQLTQLRFNLCFNVFVVNDIDIESEVKLQM